MYIYKDAHILLKFLLHCYKILKHRIGEGSTVNINNYVCYTVLLQNKKKVINIKFDMLEIHRDRLKEVEKELRINIKVKKWDKVYSLRHEQQNLKKLIKQIEEVRSVGR